MTQSWTVGELAQQAGVSVRTLHHYDEIRLLTPTRSAAGHRRYTELDVARLTQVVALDFDFAAGVLRRHVPNKQAAELIGPDTKAGDLITEEPLAESRYADVSPELIASLRRCTVSAFEVIEEAWKQHGGVYIDFKIECGFDRETGELLVADVIDSDSGRLRFGDVDMSKQSYRDGTATLPELKKKFDEVAALTDQFV